ncbi:MAG: nodulation protein NfeD [Candidatus Eisenbacteria bacterium]|nr:nodulation protein NfeD [Candidatus Eisenbacteria bacterium]
MTRNRRVRRRFPIVLGLSFCLLAAGLLAGGGWSGPPMVQVVPLQGTVNPASAELLVTAIHQAERAQREAIIIEIDTPGGLDTAMRDMVKAILSSSVPVVAYVAPTGARSASAGVFVMAAAHVVAMSPGTNLGAAHPVGLGGAVADSVLAGKVTNDAAAYIRSLARQRGRNVEWYEDAVRRSVSATETEAMDKKLIDLVARDQADLLAKLDGRKVNVLGQDVTLHTRGAIAVKTPVSLRIKILNALSDPNIAYLLLTLGFYGILFELMHPGSILPGVMGGLALLLGFFALQTLPVNYVGVLLILFAMLLFILDVKAPTHGALTVGGVIAFVMGSIMLVRGQGSGLHVAGGMVALMTALTVVFFTWIVGAAVRSRKRPVVTGRQGMVGETGVVELACSPVGSVFVHGTYWAAEGAEELPVGTRVKVVAVKGLTLKVERA